MPIGKNSIKRVTNNGYSKLTTSSPDMENSTVINTEEKKPTKKKEAARKAPKKSAPKSSVKAKAPKKKTETAKKDSAVIANPAPEVVKMAEETAHPEGFLHSALGEELPVYLL